MRAAKKKQEKGPLQLDLFEPVEHGQEYKVVVTNKRGRAGAIVNYHGGRGYQEKVFGEAKSQAQLGYVPCKRRVANEGYMICSMMAHNLGREVQMELREMARKTTAKRTVLWVFEGLARNAIVYETLRLAERMGWSNCRRGGLGVPVVGGQEHPHYIQRPQGCLKKLCYILLWLGG